MVAVELKFVVLFFGDSGVLTIFFGDFLSNTSVSSSEDVITILLLFGLLDNDVVLCFDLVGFSVNSGTMSNSSEEL